MGEAAEMLLDGYLDWDGSYSGNSGYSYHHINEKLNSVFKMLASMGVKKR